MLWCLRRTRSDVRCVLYTGAAPLEVHVFQDNDRVLKEVFPDESMAVGWAAAYAARLRAHGWAVTDDAGGARSGS